MISDKFMAWRKKWQAIIYWAIFTLSALATPFLLLIFSAWIVVKTNAWMIEYHLKFYWKYFDQQTLIAGLLGGLLAVAGGGFALWAVRMQIVHAKREREVEAKAMREGRRSQLQAALFYFSNRVMAFSASMNRVMSDRAPIQKQNLRKKIANSTREECANLRKMFYSIMNEVIKSEGPKAEQEAKICFEMLGQISLIDDGINHMQYPPTDASNPDEFFQQICSGVSGIVWKRQHELSPLTFPKDTGYVTANNPSAAA